eukprot:scaffold59691_cov31-Tisochrysis_lutea.AAC.1
MHRQDGSPPIGRRRTYKHAWHGRREFECPTSASEQESEREAVSERERESAPLSANTEWQHTSRRQVEASGRREARWRAGDHAHGCAVQGTTLRCRHQR